MFEALQELRLKIRLKNVSDYIERSYEHEGNPPKAPCVGYFFVSPDSLNLIVVTSPLLLATPESGLLGDSNRPPEALETRKQECPDLNAVLLSGWVMFCDSEGKDCRFIFRIPKSLASDNSFRDELLKQFGIPREHASFKSI